MTHSVTWEAIFHHWHFKRKIKLVGQNFLPSHHHHRPNQSGEKKLAHGILRSNVFLSGLNARSELKLLY